MLHYRSHLYSDLPPDKLYMGGTTAVDFLIENTDEDGIAFHRGVDTQVSAGLDFSMGMEFNIPPPLMKTVETLAHPDYPIGVVTETLHYEIEPRVWVPYHAKVLIEGRRAIPVMFREAMALIARKCLGINPSDLESTVSRGLWVCCGMGDNDAAMEGIQFYENNAPAAKSLLKTWPSKQDMVRRVNFAVETMAKYRDCLSQTIIESAVSDLFVNISDLPILYRSKKPITNRFIGQEKIKRNGFYMTGASPVRIDYSHHSEPYTDQFRSVFWAIDMFPLTDMDISVQLFRNGTFGDVHVEWAIDRNYVLSEHPITAGILEGHIRSICDTLTECVSYNQKANPWVFTLNELYGTDSVFVHLIKSHDELIQIVIRDNAYQVVFSMIFPSAMIKLTDFAICDSSAIQW